MLLSVQGVSRYFGALHAVAALDLAVERGAFMALLGPSGCGKTTLLRLIAGFEQADEGRIIIDGRTVVDERKQLPPEQRRVGMVFQDYALFPHLNVAENVMYGLARGPERAQRATEVLALVGMEGLGDRMPHALSGGQQQRVALARALAPRPALLLLDEPFSNLDASLRQAVRAEVRAIVRREGTTMLFVTHDQQEALSLADSVGVMLNGRVVQVDTPRTLYTRPVSRKVAAFVGEANFLPAHAAGDSAAGVLGRVPLLRAAHGPCDLLIRPENVLISPDPAGPHVVERRMYFGHDQLVELRLADGNTLRARIQPWIELDEGAHVQVRVWGGAVAFAP